MSSFKKLNTKLYQKSKPALTSDSIYWKQLQSPVLVKEFGPIDYIDFSPIEPYCFAVTCSVRVQVYNPITKLVTKNLSRFRESAYGAVFRNDGRLICSGGEEANVKLFDVASKNLLRLFKGHGAAVHRTRFLPSAARIASFSDDKTVKLWDIPTEECLHTFSNHTDYIRAGACSSISADTLISGGYDGKVNMYDTRTQNVVLEVDHGKPVESVLFLPSGGIFLSAGGTEVKVWDAVAGGRLLGCLSQHHKTVTCLSLGYEGKRLLSGSLDRHVKVYDLSNFKVTHTFDYPNAVLSLGVSKTDDTLAVGLVDGLVSISRRVTNTEKAKPEKKLSFRNTPHHLAIDTVIPAHDNGKEAKYDKCLRKFEYSKALDCVLLPYVANKTPEVTVSVLHELIKRRGLSRALVGRDVKSINQLLRFFVRNIIEPRHAKVLISAANIFLDVYDDDPMLANPEIKTTLVNLLKLLKNEDAILSELITLQGAMHMLLSAANCETLEDVDKAGLNLRPSAEAQKGLVVNLT